ncbi:MAG TPA: DUF2752 domain-containing protein, partial [Candidatus Nanopelagicales bacterium]|nr:DUF2752 domain-containing protein [Candidatus Nanopelagicales bacterium]
MVDQQVAPEGTAAPAERRSWRAAIAPYATPLAVGALVVAATAYFAVVDPNQPGHFPACPLRATTGLDCPACGGLRAVHALCHGELGTALDQNLLVTVVLLPLAVISWLLWLWRSRPGRRPAPAG